MFLFATSPLPNRKDDICMYSIAFLMFLFGQDRHGAKHAALPHFFMGSDSSLKAPEALRIFLLT